MKRYIQNTSPTIAYSARGKLIKSQELQMSTSRLIALSLAALFFIAMGCTNNSDEYWDDRYENAQLIIELTNGVLPSGDHTISWDQTDGKGNQVSTGGYFAAITLIDFPSHPRVTISHFGIRDSHGGAPTSGTARDRDFAVSKPLAPATPPVPEYELGTVIDFRVRLKAETRVIITIWKVD